MLLRYLCVVLLAALMQVNGFAQTSSDPVQAQTDLQTAPPVPDASGRYKVGHGVSAPKLIHSVEPKLKSKHRKKGKGFDGHCTLDLTVATDGLPHDIQVLRSSGEGQGSEFQALAADFDQNAIRAVEAYRFLPSTLEGKAVPVEIRVDVRMVVY